MDLIVLGSSSKGNCYLLKNESEVLMIECGVGIAEIKKALSFSFSNVVGCLLTHEHGDHAKSVKDILGLGVRLYTSGGTSHALGLPMDHHRLNVIQAGKMFTAGSFKVIPFNVEHDVKEPLGFVIHHTETGSILFITDSYMVQDRFKNINNILIEANYSQDILEEQYQRGKIQDWRRERLFASHMSLETCKLTLSRTDLSAVQNIVLIHLSDGNSNAAQFKKAIEGFTGKRVYVADAGLVIKDFHKTAF